MTFTRYAAILCSTVLAFTSVAAAGSDFNGYSYDALGRLRGACRISSLGEHRVQYLYDAADNRIYYDSADLNTVVNLGSGAVMRSPDQRFTLTMQGDGNLVLRGPTGTLWASNTAGQAGAIMQFQTDGNLVLYRSGAPIWASGTDGNQCAMLNLQNDGNLVIYAMGSMAVWATNTAGH